MSPDIISIIDRRNEFKDKPGTHALIVGVSHYPTGELATYDFRLPQLSSTALTACKVFSWLKEWQDRLKTPLVTCRLLLSPSQIEEEDIKMYLRNLPDPYPATRENFEKAAYGWLEDANSHEENITFFYFAGHGAGLTDKDTIILLQDFGSNRYKPFDGAVDTQNLVLCMKDMLARTQLYFIDSCRVTREELRKFDIQVPQLCHPRIGGIEDRLAPVFYAALPGDVAHSIKGEQTYFGKALLECLKGGAADRRRFEEFDGKKCWYISPKTLYDGLHRYINELNKEREPDQHQHFNVDGLGDKADNRIICFLDAAPQVDVVFRVKPIQALPFTKVNVLNGGRIPAGNYTINAIIDPRHPPFRDYEEDDEEIWPPCYEGKLKV